MKYLLNTLALLAITYYCTAQKVKPALNLTKGNTYYMISTANSTILQSMGGQQNKLNLTFSFKIAFTVKDVLDSVYKMEVSYQSLRMKMESLQGEIDMNSDKKDSSDVASAIVTSMMNRPFNITLSKSGKVKSVENIENMINNVFDSFPQVDTLKKIQLKNQFLKSFGAKAFKGNLEIGTAIFPEVPVAKNGSWIVNTALESVMTARMQTTYQLVAIADTYYQIHGEGTITSENNAAVTIMEGLPVKYNLTGTMTTDIKADKKTGWVSELNLKQLINGSVDIQDNPKVPGGMSIPMMINTTQVTTDK